MMPDTPLGWIGILRMGLVQAALGAIVVLTTSTLNRVMVVELALPALVPGLLVTFHHALQMLRPRWGFGSDRIGRRTPWIVGGMACLGVGGSLAALATALMGGSPLAGIALAVLAYGMIGIGAGAAGTSLLAMLAERVEPRRKPAAATIVWILMIFGFVLTAGVAGHLLDPYSPGRLVAVAVGVDATAFIVSLAAIWKLEGVAPAKRRNPDPKDHPKSFAQTFAAVWAEPQARRFTLFIFISMLAYSAQDLILEPFAGAVFGMTPGQSTTLGGLQHGGVLIGMIVVAIAGTLLDASRTGFLRGWMIAGCIGSALALLMIACGGALWPLAVFKTIVFSLGAANGVFAAAAIGSMMALASGVGTAQDQRDGTRIGIWGAAQAVAFGLGGLVGTGTADLAKAALGSATLAYSSVFTLEALAFLAAAHMARKATRASGPDRRTSLKSFPTEPEKVVSRQPSGGIHVPS